MRSIKSTVTFQRPSALNKAVGELPAGTYEIDVDEEEIFAADRIAYRKIAALLYMKTAGSTRTCRVDHRDLQWALKRDTEAQDPTAAPPS